VLSSEERGVVIIASPEARECAPAPRHDTWP
jgi:hypothetical protein